MTDGIDSLQKDIRERVLIDGPISQAHGKIFWFQTDLDSFVHWAAPGNQKVDGVQTASGVFSAEGIDLASVLLLKSLPKKSGTRIADPGAGWVFIVHVVCNLTRNGNLWMAASRHVPYETKLGENFA